MNTVELFEQALTNQGYTADSDTQLGKLIGRKMFTLDMTQEGSAMPQRGIHPQGTLNLHVELSESYKLIDIRLDGVHPTGYGYEVALRLIPLKDLQGDFSGHLTELSSMLIKSWLATCPELV